MISDKMAKLPYDPSSFTPENIRNVCILAHVDHGKTSIADSILSLNGLVSKRNVGTARYLDDREDEQKRQITMKSSAISIVDILTIDDGRPKPLPIILNLVDTPGHIDFSAEVTAAVRICDGALIVVDVVEGVAAQTKVAIKQAYDEKLKMVLVVNKIDRLILDLKQDAKAMAQSIARVIEDCNVYLSCLYHLDILNFEKKSTNFCDEPGILFNPTIGNVIFASAVDGWGFSIGHIARKYLSLVNLEDEGSFITKLWDFDAYISARDRDVKMGAIEANRGCVFVQVVTSLLYYVYSNIVVRQRLDLINDIVTKLRLPVEPPHWLHKDPRSKLRCIMEAWQPLAKCILMQSFACFPSPLGLDRERIYYLLNSDRYTHTEQYDEKLLECITALQDCSKDGPPIAYISKVLVMNKSTSSAGNAPIVYPQAKPVTHKNKDDSSIATEESQPGCSKEPTPAEAGCSSQTTEATVVSTASTAKVGSSKQKRSTKAGSSKQTTSVKIGSSKQVTAKTDSSEQTIPTKADSSNQTTQAETASEDDRSEETKVAGVQSKMAENTSDVEIIAVVRIFSGIIHVGQELYLLTSSHDPIDFLLSDDKASYAEKSEMVRKITVTGVYVLLGREHHSVAAMGPGYICGISGLSDIGWRTGTLCTSLYYPPIIEQPTMEPIVYNVVHALNPMELPKLRKGLRLLQQSDSGVKVILNESGEYMIVSAGDVHLEKCTEDLLNKFANVKFVISRPIYPMRETIGQETDKMISRIITSPAKDYHIAIDVTVFIIPDEIEELIQGQYNVIKTVQDQQIPSVVDIRTRYENNTLRIPEDKVFKTELNNKILQQLKSRFSDTFNKYEKWSTLNDTNIWRIGPAKEDTNLLINNVPEYKCDIFTTPDEYDTRIFVENLIVNSFNMCCKAGPLCEEPLRKCAFVVKSLNISDEIDNLVTMNAQQANFLTQQFRGCFRDALLLQDPVLMEPILGTYIQTDVKGVGKLYSEVQKRFGKVTDHLSLDEERKSFTVKAMIPAVESEGFAQQVRKISSGAANPTLSFSHYQLVANELADIEEQEEGEERREIFTRAQKLINEVRRRKGLPVVDDQVVVHAEKQRTLKK